MVKLETSISKLKSQMAWSAACAVRSSDGDVTGRVAATYLEKLRRFPDTARRLVDDLEVDLGDVAAARYASSLEGLRRFSYEAAQYANSIGEAAGKAASEIAMNEAKRVAASEYLLFDYFNDIKAHPLILEATREHSQNSAPGTPSQPSSPIVHFNQSPTPLAISQATGNLGMIKKRSLFLDYNAGNDENDSGDDENNHGLDMIARGQMSGFEEMMQETRPPCAIYLDECLELLREELNRANLLEGPSGPNFESALRTLSPSSAPSADLLDVKDETESEGYYETQMQLLKKKEYNEALLVIRIRGCEQMRGAVARATRLMAWARAAADEAAGLPNLHPDSPNQLGPLAHIVEARTKAEHRAVAACARHLRQIANDPSRRSSNAQNFAVGAGGNAINGLRNTPSGGEPPLIRAMRRVASEGGPLRAVGVYDGICIPDPTVGVDLGTSALTMEQLSHLVGFLCDSWKQHSIGVNKHIQEAKEMVNDFSSSDSIGEGKSLLKELNEGILAGLLPFELAESAFSLFMGLGQGEARARTISPVPSVWGHPKLVSVLAEVLQAAPWMPPRPSIDPPPPPPMEQPDEQGDQDSLEGGDGGSVSPTSSPQLPWRQMVHHLAVSVLNYIPPYDELMGMAQRLRSKKVSSGAENSGCRILVTRNDTLSSQFYFDSVHGQCQPSYPHFDFIGPSGSSLTNTNMNTQAYNSNTNNNRNTTNNKNALNMTNIGLLGGVGGGSESQEYRLEYTASGSPRSQLTSAAGQRKLDLSLNRNEIKVLKELYVNTFQQETGVRLIAVDSLLLTLAAAPNPTLSSGFADGLFRAASVASYLHPCEHEPHELPSNNNTTAAVSDMSFIDSYSSNDDQNTANDQELEASLRKHRVGKSGIVLSRKAIEMLLVVSPPPCGPVKTASSVSAFLDGGRSGYERSCISFEAFARRTDVKQWCQEGWFRLRDLSTAFAQLKSEL
jgi:hypothetical protein